MITICNIKSKIYSMYDQHKRCETMLSSGDTIIDNHHNINCVTYFSTKTYSIDVLYYTKHGTMMTFEGMRIKIDGKL